MDAAMFSFILKMCRKLGDISKKSVLGSCEP